MLNYHYGAHPIDWVLLLGVLAVTLALMRSN
jgi:hypothetical protein